MRLLRGNRPNMKTFSIQVTPEQEENMYTIAEFENLGSKAEVIRKAFDYYVKAEYPQLICNL